MTTADFQERLDWGGNNTPEADLRLGELILYIAEKMRDRPNFGSVLLNKILYFADFEAYKHFGQSITRAAYFSLPYGPAPQRLVYVRERLKETRRLDFESHRFETGEQKRPVALDKANLEFFSSEEIALVDEVIDLIGHLPAKPVSDLSHDRVWRIAGTEKGRIPYQAAFISNDHLDAYDIQRTRELARTYGWAEA